MSELDEIQESLKAITDACKEIENIISGEKEIQNTIELDATISTTFYAFMRKIKEYI